MPVQKDLKRLVRSRMQKTGESYTAARLQLVRKNKAAEPAPDYEALAGMSNAAIVKNTGRSWAEWVEVLDADRAAEKPHGQIARFVSSLGIPGWWTQAVAGGYERIRGLREKGQRRDGAYETNKSRTFAVDVDTLFAAFANARTRNRWLTGVKPTIRTAKRPKTMRIGLDDGTVVVIGFEPKGERKSQVAIQHQKVPSKAVAEKLKTFWGERFDALAALLEKKR